MVGKKVNVKVNVKVKEGNVKVDVKGSVERYVEVKKNKIFKDKRLLKI